MNPAQIHLALNHAPFVLLLAGFVFLILSLKSSDKTWKKAAYGLFLAAGILAVPVYFSGENAEEILEKAAWFKEAAAEEHEEAATFGLITGILMASGALLQFVVNAKKGDFNKVLNVVMILMSVFTMSVLLRVSYTGGKIRHTEIHGDMHGGVQIINSSPESEVQTLTPGTTPQTGEEGHDHDHDDSHKH